MPNTTTSTSTTGTLVLAGKKKRGPQARRRIPLPSGDYLQPRDDLADEIGVDPRTAQRMKLPTVYIGAVAYCPHNESLNIIAARIRRPNQPPQRGRKARG